MGGEMGAVLVVLAVVIAIVFWLISIYNNLLDLRNRIKSTFSQIEAPLARRHDLIARLANTAEARMAHEPETLEALIAARNTAVEILRKAAADPADALALRELEAAESTLTGRLGRLSALFEAVPNLEAEPTITKLSHELARTDDKLLCARQAFNEVVTGYNSAIDKIPGRLIAGSFGFLHAQLLEAGEPVAERSAVQC